MPRIEPARSGARTVPGGALAGVAVTLVAMASAALVGVGQADVNRETVVVEVGPRPITAADLLVHTDRLELAKPSGDALADRKQLIEPIVQAKLLVLEAEARGYEDEALRRQLDRLERDRLIAALEDIEIREKIVLDEAAVAEAVRRRSQILHLRHIATASESGADSLLARITAGESFADLARAHSLDSQTAAAGGELPPVSWGAMPPAFEEVAFALEPGQVGGPFPASERWHLVRLDSITPDPAPRDSLDTVVRRAYAEAMFSQGQRAFLPEMKSRLHFTVHDSVVALFLTRMQEWEAAGAPDAATGPGRDRFGFTTPERELAIFTYDGGRFTIGDYSDYMADQPQQTVITRTERDRVDRDLDQYFRHHAYSDLARERGYLEMTGFAPELERIRERALIQRMYQAEVMLPEPPSAEEIRSHAAAHPERFRAPDGAPLPATEMEEKARRDLVQEREEARYRTLITSLKERYPVVYHDEALLRLPL